jgi:hypothetical protein
VSRLFLHGADAARIVGSHPLAHPPLNFSRYVALVEGNVIVCDMSRHHVLQAATAVNKHLICCLLRATTEERECDQAAGVLDMASVLSYEGNTFNHSDAQEWHHQLAAHFSARAGALTRAQNQQQHAQGRTAGACR